MKKILIDLEKYRECAETGCDRRVPDGIIRDYRGQGGLKSLRELAVFAYSCRRCKDAPCVNVCPEEALKKDEKGMVVRSTHLCVACKSCVTACPFGTMMSDFYEYVRDRSWYYDLNNNNELERFVENSPSGAVQFTNEEPDDQKNLYELMPGIMIRDHSWEKLKKLG